MLHQGTFHLKGTNAEASTLDHVVNSTNKPEVAILVGVGHVSSVVQAVHKGFLCSLLVLVVAGKHAKGATFIQTDNDFPHFSCSTGVAFRIDNIDVVAGSRLTHGTWLWFHSVKVSDGEGQLSLAVAFLHLESSLFVKLVEDFGV